MLDPNSLPDEEVLARTLYGEARGEGINGLQAVANVIMNRVGLGWRGDTTVKGVCLRKYQFSCWLTDDPNREKILAVTDSDLVYNQCVNIACRAIAGYLEDLTGDADSYQRIGTGAYWAKGLDPTATIGHHEFFITRGT